MCHSFFAKYFKTAPKIYRLQKLPDKWVPPRYRILVFKQQKQYRYLTSELSLFTGVKINIRKGLGCISVSRKKRRRKTKQKQILKKSVRIACRRNRILHLRGLLSFCRQFRVNTSKYSIQGQSWSRFDLEVCKTKPDKLVTHSLIYFS